MGAMKDFDRRIRQSGDDAIAAVSEYVSGVEGWLKSFAALAKHVIPQWIPVSERLPEDETPVLVYCIPRDDDGTPSRAGCDGHGGIISTAWYERLGDGDGEHWVSDGLAPPLFWMPLPEPPEVK